MFRFLTLVVCCATLFLTCSFLQSDEVDETEPTAESLFDKLDQNEDGFLDPAEIPEAQQRFFSRLQRMRTDGNQGSLSRKQFLELIQRDEQSANLEAETPDNRRGRPQFNNRFAQSFDRNNDGVVELTELPPFQQRRFQSVFEDKDVTEMSINEFRQHLREFQTTNPNSNARGGQSAESNGRVAGRIAAFNRFDTNSDGTVFLDEVPRQARRTVEIWLEQAGKSSDEGLTRDEVARLSNGTGRSRTPTGEQSGDRNQSSRNDSQDNMRSARPTPLIFTKLDSDGDGQLSKAELLRILNRFEEFDRNQNGELDPGELLGFPRGAAQQNNSPQNRRPEFSQRGQTNGNRFFLQFDTDDDGKLSRDEAPNRMRQDFSRLDKNEDGFLEPDEFPRPPFAGRPPRR